MEEIREMLIQLTKGQEQLIKGQEQLNNRVGKIEVRLDKIEIRLDKVENNIETIKNSVASIAEQTANLMEFRTETKTKLSSVSEDIMFIKHRMQETEKDVVVIKDHLKIVK